MVGTKNIAIDVRALDTANVTGVDSYLRALLKAWAKDSRGHKFTLFGTPKLARDTSVLALVNKGHKFVAQAWPNKIFNTSMRFFKKPSLDRIVGGADVFFLPNPMFHAFSTGVKTVITFHDLSFERLAKIYSLKHRLWHFMVNPKAEAKRADKVLTVSNSTAQELKSLYKIPAERVQAVPLGVDFEYFSAPAAAIPAIPENYILFLGSLEPRKNVLSLIRAFDLLTGKFPDLNLVLAGSFFPQKDNKVLKEIRKNNKIVFLGQVSEADKRALYQHARGFVLPSLYEGFGLPILEAQSAGIPVITSVSTSMPEASGGAALLVNPLNINEIAQAIEMVLTNAGVRNTLISRGRENAKNHSWEKTAQKTLEIIENA